VSKSVEVSIFYPLIKRNTFLVLMLIVMLLLFFIGLILPDNYHNGSRYFSQAFFNHIPDLKYNVLHSDFPWVTTIIYLLVLVLSPILAIILCFTEANIEEAKKQLPPSMLSKVLFVTVGLIFCLLPYFFELHSTGRKYIFISKMIQKERLVFLVYSEIIFLMYIGSWAIIFGSIASLFKLLLSRK
jgi:hypothetical protein